VTAPSTDPTTVEDAIVAAWRVAGYVRDDEDPDVPTVHAWVHQAARVAADAVAARVAEQRGAGVLAALRELVRLHDGPRDAAYERDKPKAWDAARAVVADAGSAS
jgi:hypothetical protein